MKKLILTCYLFVLSACGQNVEEKYFDEPLSGERLPAKTVEIDGWNISTVNHGEILIVSKNGENIVGINTLTGARKVTIFSPSDPFGAADLIDEGADTVYEAITYRNGSLETTDIGLDGVIDGVFDFNKEELLVNYEGSLYPIISNEGEVYIFVNNDKVPMVFKHSTYVPE